MPKQPAGMSTSAQVKRDLAALADTERAANLRWFFKTAQGEYGEGDRFLGIPVPLQRKIAARHRRLPLPEMARLLRSRFHEHRFVALAILVRQFGRATEAEQENIAAFYLNHTAGSTTGIWSIPLLPTFSANT